MPQNSEQVQVELQRDSLATPLGNAQLVDQQYPGPSQVYFIDFEFPRSLAGHVVVFTAKDGTMVISDPSTEYGNCC